MKALKQSRYRYLIPNIITFISLGAGLLSIMHSGNQQFVTAGILVLVSYVLDLFDGEAARRLDAGTTFGVELDSLVDLVSLGVAPAILVFHHLQVEGGLAPLLLWPAVIIYVCAGAFRLARFNLLPVKSGQTDSLGLTISTAGATLTLATLTDIVNTGEVLSNTYFLPLLLVLAAFMVSRISFPSILWLFSRWWANLLYVVYFFVTLIVLQLSFFHVWFLFNSGYLGLTMMRAGYRVIDD